MPEVNAGSMANIAFLLLIFFLVTATISNDEGIIRKLPNDSSSTVLHQRNVLHVMVNNDEQIMVNEDVINLAELKHIAKNFIDNN